MIDSEVQESEKELAVTGTWSEPDGVEQAYVDEAVLQYINGRIYLALGQIQMTPKPPKDNPLGSIEIRPVARLVFSESSFHKILTMLNVVAARIPAVPSMPSTE